MASLAVARAGIPGSRNNCLIVFDLRIFYRHPVTQRSARCFVKTYPTAFFRPGFRPPLLIYGHRRVAILYLLYQLIIKILVDIGIELGLSARTAVRPTIVVIQASGIRCGTRKPLQSVQQSSLPPGSRLVYHAFFHLCINDDIACQRVTSAIFPRHFGVFSQEYFPSSSRVFSPLPSPPSDRYIWALSPRQTGAPCRYAWRGSNLPRMRYG